MIEVVLQIKALIDEEKEHCCAKQLCSSFWQPVVDVAGNAGMLPTVITLYFAQSPLATSHKQHKTVDVLL